jgi:DNA-binding transcriptional LysR family regulator
MGHAGTDGTIDIGMIPMLLRMAEIRWDDLQLFLVAHRTGSLTRAAARLGLNQSTTSRRLRAFEDVVGQRLFDRTPEGLLLTETGQRLLGAAEQAEAAALEAARVCMGTEVELDGEVRIAISEGLSFYLVAPAVPRLMQRHPGIRISMLVSDAIADLTRREADIALRFIRPTRGDLVAQRIYAGGYGIFAAPQLAARLGPGPHRIAALPFVGWDATQSHFPEGAWEQKAGVNCVVRATSLPTRIALAEAGAGAIELAREWGSTLPNLVLLDTEPCPLRGEIWLVTHRGIRDVPRIRAVWDFLVEQFAARWA